MKFIYSFILTAFFLLLSGNNLKGQDLQRDTLQRMLDGQSRETLRSKAQQLAMYNDFDKEIDIKDAKIVKLKMASNSRNGKSEEERKTDALRIKKHREERTALRLQAEKALKRSQEFDIENKRIGAELNVLQAEKESDLESIAYWKNRAQKYIEERDSVSKKVIGLIQQIKEQEDIIWKMEIEIERLEDKLNEVTRSEAYYRRRSYVKDAQDACKIDNIRCVKSKERSIMDVKFEMTLPWKDTRDAEDSSFQFVLVRMKPQVIVYNKGKQETMLSLDEGYEMDGYRIYQQVISDTNINPHIALKLKLRNGKFDFFRKKKVSYKIPLEVYLAKLGSKREIILMDLFAEGDLILRDGGMDNEFVKHIQKNIKVWKK